MRRLYSSEEEEDEESTEEEEEEQPARYAQPVGWMRSILSGTPRNDNGTPEVSPLSSTTGEVHSLAQVSTKSPSPPKRKSKEISKERRITRSQSLVAGAASVSGNSYSTRSQANKKKAKN